MIPSGGRVLDLMTSWVGHLPDDVAYADVVSHGMNAEGYCQTNVAGLDLALW